MLWRHRPARSARFSRDNPTSTRAAWSCEPESRIIVMKKLCVRWRLRTTSIILTKPQTPDRVPCAVAVGTTVAVPRRAIGEGTGAILWHSGDLPTACPKADSGQVSGGKSGLSV